MGAPDFAVPSLRLIKKNYNIVAVYSQPARPSGRGMRTKLSPVEKTAKKLMETYLLNKLITGRAHPVNCIWPPRLLNIILIF